MEYKLPIIVQSVVYRRSGDDIEFLLLKRSPDRGSFWSSVNGTLHGNETVEECARRELSEEIDVNSWLWRSDELSRFSFEYKGAPQTTLVFAVEISPKDVVRINEEHEEYKWLPSKEAKEILKFDEDKAAIDLASASIT